MRRYIASSSFTFGLGGFARSYFGDPAAKTLFFGEFSIGLGSYSNPSYGSSNMGSSIDGALGMSYLLSQK